MGPLQRIRPRHAIVACHDPRRWRGATRGGFRLARRCLRLLHRASLLPLPLLMPLLLWRTGVMRGLDFFPPALLAEAFELALSLVDLAPPQE